MPETPQALEDVLEARKRLAEREAAKKGHTVGGWMLGSHDWEAICLTRGCTARLSMSPTLAGGIAGATAYSTTCPHKAAI